MGCGASSQAPPTKAELEPAAVSAPAPPPPAPPPPVQEPPPQKDEPPESVDGGRETSCRRISYDPDGQAAASAEGQGAAASDAADQGPKRTRIL
eukprot:6731446-Prymnesium_polylepis.1